MKFAPNDKNVSSATTLTSTLTAPPRYVVGQQVAFYDTFHNLLKGRISNVIDHYGAYCYHIVCNGNTWHRYVDQQQIIS